MCEGLRNEGKKEIVCKDILRIAVFFDGTGNNRFNDIADTSKLKAKTTADRIKRNAVQIDPKDPDRLDKLTPLAKFNEGKNEVDKEDKRSNISLLFSLFEEGGDVDPVSKTKARHCYSVYNEGVGTNAGRGDYTSGMGFGNGGAYRINEAIKQVQSRFSSYSEDKWERIIDVFGFSRGAAQARDFINTFNMQFDRDDYKFGYVGIFDTVGSFGLTGTLGNDKNFKPVKPKDPGLKKRFDLSVDGSMGEHEYIFTDYRTKHYFTPFNFNLHNSSADRIVHIKAADEVRYNFPLSDISGTVHPEWTHIGVHSDIGGGYADEFENNNIDKVWMERKTFVSKDNYEQYLKEIERDGCKAKIIVEPYLWTRTVVKYKERAVKSGLAIISLHLMHRDAKQNHVPFKDLPNDRDFGVPSDLDHYFEHCEEGPRNTANTTNYPFRSELTYRYVHRSHKDSVLLDGAQDAGTMFPRYKGQKDTYLAVFHRAKGRDFERNIFTNKPSKAVIK